MQSTYCNDSALCYLRDMFEGKHSEAVYEWTVTVAKLGQIVPDEYVSALLPLGDEIDSMRPYIIQITGQSYDENRLWVADVANNLSDHLYDLHVQECENDAFMIGAVTYGVWLTEYLSNRRGMIDTQFMYPYYDLHNVYKFKIPWSKPLTKTILWAKNEGFAVGFDSPEFAYRLSPTIDSDKIREMRFITWKLRREGMREYPLDSETIDRTLPIFDYRQQMLEAINRG